MEILNRAICLIFLFVAGANCDCGATERRGNQGEIDYSFDSGYQVESCTWTLTPIYDTDLSGTVPDLKTMLIVTVNQYEKGLGGKLYLPGSSQFDSDNVGKCYRFKQSWDTKCSSDSFSDVCSTPVETLGKTTLGKYQIFNLAMMSSASISYQFVKCDGNTERGGTESSEKPPQGECGSVEAGLKEGKIHFDFSATTSLEICSWTLTPPSSNTVLPDRKTMLIVTVSEYDGGVSGNLYMPDLTKFDSTDVGKCFRYKQSWDTKCHSDSFKDVCDTPIVTLGTKSMGKYKIFNLAMMSSARIHYQFVSCEESAGKVVPVITTEPTTKKTPESCTNDAEWCNEITRMLELLNVEMNVMKTELSAQEISFFIQKEEVKRLEEKVGQQAEIIAHLSLKLNHLEDKGEKRLAEGKVINTSNTEAGEAGANMDNNRSATVMESILVIIAMLITSTVYQFIN